MKVTVREVLQMDILKEAKVLAGESGLDVRIRNASVLEGLRSDEISSYAGRTGELVISGFFHIKDDIEEQCAIVRALAQKGCAALVLMYVGDVLPEVSDELIDAAEKAGLPLCGAGDCLLLPPGGGAHQRPSGDLPMARRGTIICRIACKIKRMVL